MVQCVLQFFGVSQAPLLAHSHRRLVLKLTRSVLRDTCVASKQKLEDRLMAAADHFNRHPLSRPGRTTLIELLL